MKQAIYKNFNSRWSHRLNQKVWTKSDIQALTKTLGSARFEDAESELRKNIEGLKQFLTHHSSPDLNGQYHNCWGEAFHFSVAYKITKEQAAFGIEWLRRYTFTSKGEIRKQAQHCFSDLCVRVIKSFKKFEFVGVLEVRNHYGANNFLPIYRTHGAKGEFFDYSPIHWGQPVVSNEESAV